VASLVGLSVAVELPFLGDAASGSLEVADRRGRPVGLQRWQIGDSGGFFVYTQMDSRGSEIESLRYDWEAPSVSVQTASEANQTIFAFEPSKTTFSLDCGSLTDEEDDCMPVNKQPLSSSRKFCVGAALSGGSMMVLPFSVPGGSDASPCLEHALSTVRKAIRDKQLLPENL
jgi:hypothetical protein